MLTNFLELRLDDPTSSPTLKCVCAGYELGEWRAIQLSKYLIRDCLLDFALTEEEKAATTPKMLDDNWQTLLTGFTPGPRYEKRGEIGELLFT